MKIVSGKIGKPHVTSHEFRQIIEGTIGQESYILKSGDNLEPELVSNNLLKIKSGMMSHHGNVSSVENYDEIELTNGTQGMKRIDLIVNRYTRNDETKIENNSWICIVGTPDASSPTVPYYTAGNLQEGDLIDDCPVLQISYDGINVTGVKKLLSVAKNSSEMESEITELNRNLKVYTFSKSATVSYSGNNTMSVKCYRQGNIVTTYISYTGTLPKGIIGLSPSGVSGITIPNGFRPNNDAYGSYVGVSGTSVYESDNGRFNISTSGGIFHGCTEESYHERHVTITYHTDDPIPN